MEYMARIWLFARRFPASLRLWRALNSQFRDIYQYLNLIFGSTTLYLPPAHSVTTGEALLQLLEARKINDKESKELRKLWNEAQRLLQSCPELNSLYDIHDERGFNAMLVAVINSDTSVLQMLINEGCDVNRGKCTLPLHIACHLGSIEMVTFLMNNGANAEIEAGMCYPRFHKSVRHMPSRFHFLETDVFHCDSDHVLPLIYAIRNNHVDIVKCLLNTTLASASDVWPYNKYPLHCACKYGSYDCIKYLLEIDPNDELNRKDESNMTPLLYIVKWGQRYVKMLVEAGANVLERGKNEDTILHLLYNDVKVPLEVYETTKYLLATGVEQHINKIDVKENNALHAMIALVNRLVHSFDSSPDSAEGTSRMLSHKDVDEEIQSAWDEEVLNTIKLLLSMNCDPNTVNIHGVTPMHKLLLILDFVLSDDASGVTIEMLPVRDMYRINFHLLTSVLQCLLDHNADPNMVTISGRTPLMLLLQTLLSLESVQFSGLSDKVLDCIVILCKAGARPGHKLYAHLQVVMILARLGLRCLSQRDPQLQREACAFFNRLLATLLEYGLDANYCRAERSKIAEGGSGNLLLEVVKLAQYVRDAKHLDYVYDWVLTLLQHGTNPDLEPYNSEPVICHSQSNIYLKKEEGNQPVKQYMDDIQDINNVVEGEYAERLLMLFYNSMDHKALFHCMTMTRLQSRFDPNRRSGAAFIQLINELLEKPRSLQQIARVAIFKSVNRKLVDCIPKLSLPHSLQDYLVNIR